MPGWGDDLGRTAPQERRKPSGAVTARRPQTAHLLDEQAAQAARRRVHVSLPAPVRGVILAWVFMVCVPNGRAREARLLTTL